MNIMLTGASRGIGYQIALELCRRGIDRLMIISRNKEALNQLKEQCMQINGGVEILLVSQDISKVSQKVNFAAEYGWKHYDVLINNAGYLVNKPFVSMEDEDMQKMFEVNVHAPSRLIRNNIQMLANSSLSHVVNISSMGGFQGSSKFPGLSYYSSSKAALACLTECLAEEFKETSIRFNCLALGAVQTEMLEEAFPGYKAPISSEVMGKYIVEFALSGHKIYNGKVLPVTLSNP
jgi:3-oxoacyl-[acyl-carrier protein] reductase